jgi:hypothetical protein
LEQSALSALKEIWKTKGQARPGIMDGQRCVSRDEWLTACIDSGAIGQAGKDGNAGRDFDRRQTGLIALGLIVVDGFNGFVRPTEYVAMPPKPKPNAAGLPPIPPSISKPPGSTLQ